MRKLSVVFAALVGLSLAAPSGHAERIKFSPDTFAIYGGLGVGNENGGRTKKRGYVAAKLTVDFPTDLPAGSVVVRTGERKLYYVLEDGKAIQYPVGVGREGFEWSGKNRITRKATWPDWRPPRAMIAREAAKGKRIPAFMPGGPQNPLGARALYIGDTEYRIHGTSQPWTIGMASSSGCIRMLNEQVIDLYNRVEVGATVVVE
jgi:lipoprotein-anchoring transpeptidase ErfK/SrfK